MSEAKIRRALISVYDKTGIVKFASSLHGEFGIEIISTGGTASLLKENGIPVTLVEEVTGFPEMLDGRVKTLHPKIHAGILADRDNPEHMKQLADQGIKPIDMVVVNLYPFEKTIAQPDCTFEQAIEMIDIGGPCMLRAAAKNHQHVWAVTKPENYESNLAELHDWGTEKFRLFALNRGGIDAFANTCAYDAAIVRWLTTHESGQMGFQSLFLEMIAHLRYGENPHQSSSLLTYPNETSLEDWHAQAFHATTEISFNNYVDANAALSLCSELNNASSLQHRQDAGATKQPGSQTDSVCVFIKHTNACGVGVAKDPAESYRQAYLGDPNAAMGSILACDFKITQAFAELVMGTFGTYGKEAGAGGFFVEVWVAPSFDEQAVTTIRTAKKWGERVRLLPVGEMRRLEDQQGLEYKCIAGGMLAQTRDLVGLNEDQWNVATSRPPTDQELADLRLAWLICKHTKSNAITICKDGMLMGNGAGQMSRVMSCRIAAWLAEENGHADKLKGSVAASDAFFPFRDGPEMLINAGVTAIIQPGGSKRDQEVIDACNEHNVAMIFTGTRHFKH